MSTRPLTARSRSWDSSGDRSESDNVRSRISSASPWAPSSFRTKARRVTVYESRRVVNCEAAQDSLGLAEPLRLHQSFGRLLVRLDRLLGPSLSLEDLAEGLIQRRAGGHRRSGSSSSMSRPVRGVLGVAPPNRDACRSRLWCLPAQTAVNSASSACSRRSGHFLARPRK